jgi:thiol-disulfide isomerase/thioredoxin
MFRLWKLCFFHSLVAGIACCVLPATWGQDGSLKSDGLVLYFQSEQCPPCRQLDPLLLDYASRGWDIRKVEAPRQLDLARQYRIENLPTLVLISGGREVDRIVGLVSQRQLDERMQRLQARQRLQPPASSSVRQSTNQGSAQQSVPVARNAGPVIRGQSPAMATTQASLAASASRRGAADGYPLLSEQDTTSEFAAGESPNAYPNHSAAQQAQPVQSLQSSIERATDATVRIKVEESNTIAYGTGTIVATHGQEALVLTCGHLFRDMLPGSHLKVELFAGTPRQTTVVAQLIDFKAEKEDIGLLSFRLPMAIEPVSILPRSEKVSVGQQVFSVGCDHGNDPTRRDTRITHVNRYLGPSNIEIEGAPAVGRSGGGLFDAQGRLIGVCNAACNQDNEGIYAASEVIYEQLARLNLNHLFDSKMAANSSSRSESLSQPPEKTNPNPVPSQVPTVLASQQTRGQQPDTAGINWPDEQAFSAQAADTSSPPEVSASGTNQQVQLICVVRSTDGTDRVVTINQPSSALLQAIETHRSTGSAQR